jgi:hypothetical protein
VAAPLREGRREHYESGPSDGLVVARGIGRSLRLRSVPGVVRIILQVDQADGGQGYQQPSQGSSG